MKFFITLILFAFNSLLGHNQCISEAEIIINEFLSQNKVKNLFYHFDNNWFLDKNDSLLITRKLFKKAKNEQDNNLIDSVFARLDKKYITTQILWSKDLAITDKVVNSEIDLISKRKKSLDPDDYDYFVISYPIFTNKTNKSCFLYYSFKNVGNLILYFKKESKWIKIAEASIWII